MFRLFKVFIFVFISMVVFFAFLFYTALGNRIFYHYLGSYLSKKNDLDIKVNTIDISRYPVVVVNALVDKKYTLDIEGRVDNLSIKGKYILQTTARFGNRIYVSGDVDAKKGDIKIVGSGVGLDGKIKYSLKKREERYQDVKLELIDINSSKLAKLLEQKIIFRGKADANLSFSIIDKYHKKGTISYHVVDNNFSNLKINLNTKIFVNDKKHKFRINVLSKGIGLKIYDGKYNEENKTFHSFYKFDIDNLERLSPVLKMPLVGDFNAMGEIEYDKTLAIKGLSKSLGGYTKFFYKDDSVSIDVEGVSLENLSTILDKKAIFGADANGYIHYDFLNKEMMAKMKLNNTIIFENKEIDLLSEKIDMNLSKEIFDKSFIEIHYKDKMTTANLGLINKNNHILASHMKINMKKREIETQLDIKLAKYQLEGNLYLKENIYLAKKKREDTTIHFEGKVQKYYRIGLTGLFNTSLVDINYTLGSHRLPSPICTIENDVNLTGYVNGYWNKLHILSKGTAIDGEVFFEAIKIDNELKDVSIRLKKVHAQKLFTLFGKPTYPHGWTNAKLTFSELSSEKQEGIISYELFHSKLLQTDFYLNTKIKVNNKRETFVANIRLADSDVNITKGRYNRDTNKTYLFYKANIKALSKLEKIISQKYYGSVYAIGEVFYEKELKVLGMSKSYGGILDYEYHKEKLNISLNDVYLKNILHLFAIPKLLDAKSTGDIFYDFKTKKLEVNTKLSEGRFLTSKLSKTIRKKSGLDLEKEIFDDSSLSLTYQNKIILGDLLLKNSSGTILLRKTKIDIKRDKIKAYFDFNMTKQKFSGKVYGKLSSPKVKLDMQKLIEFQVDNQLDNIMGKQNREMIESLPMGNVAKDIGTGMAGSLMGIFF